MEKKKEFWFKIIKWDTDKPDFCKVYAVDKTHAMYEIENQLLSKSKSLNCEYFSTSGKYKRNIEDIQNFFIVPYSQVEKHINKINYAIEMEA